MLIFGQIFIGYRVNFFSKNIFHPNYIMHSNYYKMQNICTGCCLFYGKILLGAYVQCIQFKDLRFPFQSNEYKVDFRFVILVQDITFIFFIQLGIVSLYHKITVAH